MLLVVTSYVQSSISLHVCSHCLLLATVGLTIKTHTSVYLFNAEWRTTYVNWPHTCSYSSTILTAPLWWRQNKFGQMRLIIHIDWLKSSHVVTVGCVYISVRHTRSCCDCMVVCVCCRLFASTASSCPASSSSMCSWFWPISSRSLTKQVGLSSCIYRSNWR